MAGGVLANTLNKQRQGNSLANNNSSAARPEQSQQLIEQQDNNSRINVMNVLFEYILGGIY